MTTLPDLTADLEAALEEELAGFVRAELAKRKRKARAAGLAVAG